MNAIEFYRQHRLIELKRIVESYPNHTHVTDDARMFINENTCNDFIKNQLHDVVGISELKEIVKAFDIVNALGGLHMAKADAMDLDGFENDSPYWNKVKQAINLVEQCNE